MRETLKNLQILSELYEGNTDYTNEALREAVIEYKQTTAPEAFSFIYTRIYGVIYSVSSKYSYITEHEKASMGTEILHESIMDYDLSMGQSIQYYFSVRYNNGLLTEVQSQQTHKRKANEQAGEFGAVISEVRGKEEDRYRGIELYEALKKFGLNSTELAYCKKVLTTNSEVRNVDIAQELGVSPSAIHQMKYRLKEKIKENNLFYLLA